MCRCKYGTARLFRSKSKDEFKEKHEYKHTHTQSREHGRPKWFDSDDKCDCDDYRHRGRPLTRVVRTPWIHGEGSPLQQNVNHQNINIVPGCHSHRPHSHSRSSSRDHSHSHERGQASPHLISRHSDGHCCIHGRGWTCPTCHPHRPYRQHPLDNYMPITNDDGKVDLYDLPRFMKAARDFADEVQRKRREDEEAKMRNMYATADAIQKMFEPLRHQGGGWGPEEYDNQRSSAEIKAELDRLRADRKQLSINRYIEHGRRRGDDQRAMCSGALQDDQQGKNRRLGISGSADPGWAFPSGRVMEIVDDDDGKEECSCGLC